MQHTKVHTKIYTTKKIEVNIGKTLLENMVINLKIPQDHIINETIFLITINEILTKLTLSYLTYEV